MPLLGNIPSISPEMAFQVEVLPTWQLIQGIEDPEAVFIHLNKLAWIERLDFLPVNKN